MIDGSQRTLAWQIRGWEYAGEGLSLRRGAPDAVVAWRP